MIESIFINAIYALAIAVVALIAASWAKSAILRMPAKHDRFDPTLAGFFGSLARYAILAFAGVAILGRFGIETTSLAALIAAGGLAIGLALQGTLGHLAAGVLLIFFRPVKVGDFVQIAGESGTVKAVSLFNTELATPDNVQIIVPNGDVFSSPIVNYSTHPTRRVDMVFGVSYDSDLKKAETILHDLIEADSRIHADPEPFVKVTNLGDSSVDFTVRVWADAADYWDVRFAFTRAVKDAFDAGGIDIPFPTSIEISKAA